MEPKRRRARSESGAGPLRARNSRLGEALVREKLRWCASAHAFKKVSMRALAKLTDQSRGKIEYWHRKAREPRTFHPKPHGGAYHFKFDPETRQMLETIVWAMLQQNNTLTAPVLTVRLIEHGLRRILMTSRARAPQNNLNALLSAANVAHLHELCEADHQVVGLVPSCA